MPDNVVGAQLYTVREFTQTMPQVVETFQKVAKIGYSAVQVSGFGPVDQDEVARAAADCGLKIVATHLGWDQFLEDIDAVIERHKVWGCNHPAIGGIGAEYRSADGIKRFVDELAPVAEKLAAADMDFSYHNHNWELALCGDVTWLELLYSTATPQQLKAEIDTYWIQAGGGDPAAWIRKCARRIPLLHLKDMAMGSDGQKFAEIGEGNLNWPSILDASAASGVEWYLVEQDNCYDRDPFESLAISYRNLQAMGLS